MDALQAVFDSAELKQLQHKYLECESRADESPPRSAPSLGRFDDR